MVDPLDSKYWWGILFALLFNSPGTEAATLRLSGVVLPSKKLEVKTFTGQNQTRGEESGTIVLAAISEKSNDSDGYTVTLSAVSSLQPSGKISEPDSTKEERTATSLPTEVPPLAELPRVYLRTISTSSDQNLKHLVLALPSERTAEVSYSQTLAITLVAN